MAALGEEPDASSKVAEHLARRSNSFGPVRASHRAKSMFYASGYGETDFPVPLSDAFMRRAIPEQCD